MELKSNENNSRTRGRMPGYSKSGMDLVKGRPVSQEELKVIHDFTQGYDLVGLEKIKNYQTFFNEKGINYTRGLIKRFSKKTDGLLEKGLGEVLICQMGLSKYSEAYFEAKKFRDVFFRS